MLRRVRAPFHGALMAFVGALCCLALVLLPGTAFAGMGAGAGPTFPTSVNEGDTGVPVSIEVNNNNTPPQVSSVVCNNGDPFPCPIGDPGITLIPSCGQLGAFSVCAPAGADPGVIAIPPTGTGAPGTACAGMVFDITPIDPTFGQLRFTPQGGAHVILPAPGTVCRINFTMDVLKLPTVDQDPGTAGAQTVQIVDVTMRSGDPSSFLTASARGTSLGMTVNPKCQDSGGCNPLTAARASIVVQAPKKGCRKSSFNVYVKGRSIRSVTFRIDGRRVARRTRANYRGTRFAARMRPSTLKRGRHRLTTQVRFQTASGSKTKTLKRTFWSCA